MSEDDLLWAVGLPVEPAQCAGDARNLNIRLHTLGYATVIRPDCVGERHPARGLHLDWTCARDAEGRDVEPVNPRGMSGGGVWRFRGNAEEQVWHPSKIGRLIGVASSMFPEDKPRCERCESVSDFGEWFFEKCEEIAGP